MTNIRITDLSILLFYLVVYTGGEILPESQGKCKKDNVYHGEYVIGLIKNCILDGEVSFERRFLLDNTPAAANISLEQFASCYLTCLSGYEKLTEACCKTGIGEVCSNLPWSLLKPRLGTCSDLPVFPVPSVWKSLEQFAACSLTCVAGYVELTAVCCQTGIDDVCLNLPWDLLKPRLGSCEDSSLTTSTMSIPTTTHVPFWLPWGSWACSYKQGSCFQSRLRNCSTGVTADCKTRQGGVEYNIGLCTEISCPEYFTTTTMVASTASTAQTGTCQDDTIVIGCSDKDILTEVCKEKATAWNFCRKSCGLCDTCWDYLNCSTSGAQKLFCTSDSYAVKYCRQTCGRCDHEPVDVQLNKCGDPVATDELCVLLQAEICICNDMDVRILCANYCDNKCTSYPFNGSSCSSARRMKRDTFLSQVLLN